MGLGGAEIGYEAASQSVVDRIVRVALDNGVNVLDTAECYIDSEEKLGRALEGLREQFRVFSKCGHASGLPFQDWTPQLISASIDRSLQRLKTDYLDLIQLHSCSAAVLRAGEVINARTLPAMPARFVLLDTAVTLETRWQRLRRVHSIHFRPPSTSPTRKRSHLRCHERRRAG